MDWCDLKCRLLEAGTIRVADGDPIPSEQSTAGPGTGKGSLFFSDGTHRVRLGIDPEGAITYEHLPDGKGVRLFVDGETVDGFFEPVGAHCPRQAYITVSEGCIFDCKYCGVPLQEKRIKSIEEVLSLIEGVYSSIEGISITSGIIGSIEEEEDRICALIPHLKHFNLPIGISIYPTTGTAERLFALGVDEVKFNIETATVSLFQTMCPGFDRSDVWQALEESVPLFGRDHVFSNLIFGLGETDDELFACMQRLAGIGVIPVMRPLSPTPRLPGLKRPDAARIRRVAEQHEKLLKDARLDTRFAQTMCIACTGCDIVPGRDT